MTSVHPAYSPRQKWVVVLLAGIYPLGISVVGAMIIASWLPELPAQIAIHWDAAGEVNGFANFWGLAATLVGVALVVSGSFSLSVINLSDDAAPVRGRLLVATSVAITTAVTTGIVASAGLQRGSAAPPDLFQVGQWLLVGVGFGAVLGALAFVVSPSSVQADPRDAPYSEPIELSPEERAVWTGIAAPSGRFLALYAGLVAVVLGSSIFAATQDPSAVVTVVVGVVVLLAGSVLRWRITVSRFGLVARGALGLPRLRIPLADIAQARVARVDAFSEFGGWGLRFAARRTGIILRSGDAIEVTRVRGRALVVTVDGAETGAALLNGFLARARE